MVMDLIRQAAGMNNHGARLLSQGNLNEARKALHSSLKMLKQASDNESTSGTTKRGCIQNNSSSSKTQESSPPADCCPPLDSYCKFIPLEEHTNSKEDQFYVYNHAVLFSPNKDTETMATRTKQKNFKINVSLCSAVTLFNLGLCYHRKGVTTTTTNTTTTTTTSSDCTTSSTSLLIKAASLYDHSIQFVKKIAASLFFARSDRHKGGHFILLFTVTLNNQAQIYHYLADKTKTHQLLEELSVILEQPGGDILVLLGMDKENIVSKFWLNTLLGHDYPRCYAAPCA